MLVALEAWRENPMKQVIAVRHVAFEHLGTLAPLLGGRGFRIRYLDAGVADLAAVDPGEADLLVVLGGPIGANEDDRYPYLRDELDLLERRLAAGRPTLGICLGAQLMARALGGRVYPGRAKEIGWAPVRLNPAGERSPLRELASCDYRVLHWHGDTFDPPPGADCLASTPVTPNQAFSLGPKILALQFHLELDPAEIERWLIGHAHEIGVTPGATPAGLRAATARHGAALARAAAACMQTWLERANLLPAPASL
jgi:GMP synthase (glutamine-hydrolysing)